MDPLREKGGGTYPYGVAASSVIPSVPQMNLYQFAGNNGVNCIDPYGLDMANTWANYGRYGANWEAFQNNTATDVVLPSIIDAADELWTAYGTLPPGWRTGLGEDADRIQEDIDVIKMMLDAAAALADEQNYRNDDWNYGTYTGYMYTDPNSGGNYFTYSVDSNGNLVITPTPSDDGGDN